MGYTALAIMMAVVVAFADEFWLGPTGLSLLVGFPISIWMIPSLSGKALLMGYVWVPFLNALGLGVVLGVGRVLYEQAAP